MKKKERKIHHLLFIVPPPKKKRTKEQSTYSHMLLGLEPGVFYYCTGPKFNLMFSDLVKADFEKRMNQVPFQIKDRTTSDIYYIFWYLDAVKTATPTCPGLCFFLKLTTSFSLYIFFLFVWNFPDGWNPEKKIFYSKASQNFSSNSL